MSMSWLEYVDRPNAIRAVFGATDPNLDALRLHEIVLHQDGPTVVLRFDLADYPAIAPPKWVVAGHNTVQVCFALAVVTDLSVQGWTLNNIGRLEVRPAGARGFTVEFVSSGSSLVAVCGFVRVDSVRAYKDSAKSQ
jgi:hypothetical protein